MDAPLKKLRPLTEAALLNMVKELEQKASTTWAVYAECQQHDMTWKITKIIPWYERDGGDGNTLPPFKMTGCRDEIDAYKKFMEQTK